MSKVATCLWFDRDAEAAVDCYVALLPGSSIERVHRGPAAWPGGDEGDVILIEFTLAGQHYQALNGGSRGDYGTVASISVMCADQAEVDRLWAAITGDGGQEILCGWARDRWGVPWQIVPQVMLDLLADPDRTVAARAFAAMQTMVKLDAAALERAARA